ncbi:MAG: hypothetical protein ACRC8Y_26960 [Chroococcales cyanobacterium]
MSDINNAGCNAHLNGQVKTTVRSQINAIAQLKHCRSSLLAHQRDYHRRSAQIP